MSDDDLNVSRETSDDLENKYQAYLNLLEKWNNSFSLVQSDSLKQYFDRHLADSLQLIKYITDKTHTILDVGSGAGFPAIPLATHSYQITASEIVSKKISFLKYCRYELALNTLDIYDGDVYLLSKSYDVVTSRAFSELDNLLKIQSNVSRETTYGLYLKGKTYEAELEKAREKWGFDAKIYPSQTSSEGVILEIRNLKAK